MTESEMQTFLSPALQQPPKRPVGTTLGDSQATGYQLAVLCALCTHQRWTVRALLMLVIDDFGSNREVRAF